MVAHLRSNIVAYLALFVALGGTSYAAINLPKNSVGSKQIKANAVGTEEVRNGALLPADLNAASLQALRGPPGPPGAQGTPGVPGPQGLAGPVFGATQMTANALGDPRPQPDGPPNAPYTFTLPNAGVAYVQFFMPGISLDCTFGEGYLGLYIDGSPLPGATVVLSSGANGNVPVLLAGIANLAAGQHTADSRQDCPGGSPSSGGFVHREAWTVLLLGNQ